MRNQGEARLIKNSWHLSFSMNIEQVNSKGDGYHEMEGSKYIRSNSTVL